MVNISARIFAGAASETLIAGFVIDGNVPKRVLIRGVGPSLEDLGVPDALRDPRVEVHARQNDVDLTVSSNDDWDDEPMVAEISDAVGAFPLRAQSRDAAIVMTLPAGAYTAVVSSVQAAIGEALVEVYAID